MGFNKKGVEENLAIDAMIGQLLTARGLAAANVGQLVEDLMPELLNEFPHIHPTRLRKHILRQIIRTKRPGYDG